MEIIEFFFLCLFEFKLLSRIISEMEPRTKAKKKKMICWIYSMTSTTANVYIT